jgi:hypothetical protein
MPPVPPPPPPQVSCNIAGLSHPTFSNPPVPYVLAHRHTNRNSLEAAVDAAAEVLGHAVKPVLLAGGAHDGAQPLGSMCRDGQMRTDATLRYAVVQLITRS